MEGESDTEESILAVVSVEDESKAAFNAVFVMPVVEAADVLVVKSYVIRAFASATISILNKSLFITLLQ